MKFVIQTGPESVNSLFPVIQVEHFGSAILPVIGGGGAPVSPWGTIKVTVSPGSNAALLRADKIIKTESLLTITEAEAVAL